jgi:hypothetical protein
MCIDGRHRTIVARRSAVVASVPTEGDLSTHPDRRSPSPRMCSET